MVSFISATLIFICSVSEALNNPKLVIAPVPGDVNSKLALFVTSGLNSFVPSAHSPKEQKRKQKHSK